MHCIRLSPREIICPITGEVLPILTPEEIAEYASGIDHMRFPFFCSLTGELSTSLFEVIRTTFHDYVRYRFVHHWHYTRNWQ